jgi:hypothetical protein
MSDSPASVDWSNSEACKGEVAHYRAEAEHLRGLYEEQVRRAERAEDELEMRGRRAHRTLLTYIVPVGPRALDVGEVAVVPREREPVHFVIDGNDAVFYVGRVVWSVDSDGGVTRATVALDEHL